MESPKQASWILDFLAEARQGNWCNQIGCTTCGALPFRRGLVEYSLKQIDEAGHKIADAGEHPLVHNLPSSVAEAIARNTLLELSRLPEQGPEGFKERWAYDVGLILSELSFGLYSQIDLEVIPKELNGSWVAHQIHRYHWENLSRREKRREKEFFESPAEVARRREEKQALAKQRQQLPKQAPSATDLLRLKIIEDVQNSSTCDLLLQHFVIDKILPIDVLPPMSLASNIERWGLSPRQAEAMLGIVDRRSRKGWNMVKSILRAKAGQDEGDKVNTQR